MARRTAAVRRAIPPNPPEWWLCEKWPTGDWQEKFAREAFEREPAVAVGGPWTGYWYWIDDLRDHVAIAIEMHEKHGQRRGAFCDYTETGERTEHPDKKCRGIYGRVFAYHELSPEPPRAIPDPQWRVAPAYCACGERLLLSGQSACERCRLGHPMSLVWSYEPGQLTHHDSAWWDLVRPGAEPREPADAGPDGLSADPEPELSVVSHVTTNAAPSVASPDMTPEQAADWAWQYLAPLYDR